MVNFFFLCDRNAFVPLKEFLNLVQLSGDTMTLLVDVVIKYKNDDTMAIGKLLCRQDIKL